MLDPLPARTASRCRDTGKDETAGSAAVLVNGGRVARLSAPWVAGILSGLFVRSKQPADLEVSRPARPRRAVRESSANNRRIARILLATDGRPIPDATIARVLELAPLWGASVRVFSIVRIYGHAFGLPNARPLPTKHDWERQRAIVADAVKRLGGKGVEVDGEVLATRTPAKTICDEATKEGWEAIVMSAGPTRNRLVGYMLWSQEPQRVRRRARMPVVLVLGETSAMSH